MPVTHHELRWRCSISTCCHENRGRDKNCRNCGKPKEGEVFYDPEEGEGPALTDAVLIQQATAGTDWQCTFCGSHQRRSSGECANCGAEQAMSRDQATKWDDGHVGEGGLSPAEEERVEALLKAAKRVEALPKPKRRPKLTDEDVEEICSEDPSPSSTVIATPVPVYRRNYRPLALGSALFFGILLLGALVFFLVRPVEVDARVQGVSWKYTVQVEREKTVHEEGFDAPIGAFDVLPMGERHHHYRQVPDGFRTVSYLEEYQCGTIPRTCTRTPRTCTRTPRTCTNNQNGFKTCMGGDEICSGGQESCTGGGPRYCTRPATRQEPKFRDESVTAMWYSWNVWRWVLDRQVKAEGSTDKPHWPSAEKIALNKNLPNGVRAEREERVTSYTVTFRDDEGESYTYHPKEIGEFESFHAGEPQLIKVNKLGSVEIVRAQ